MQIDLYEIDRKSRNDLELKQESIRTILSRKVEYNDSVSVHLISLKRWLALATALDSRQNSPISLF